VPRWEKKDKVKGVHLMMEDPSREDILLKEVESRKGAERKRKDNA